MATFTAIKNRGGGRGALGGVLRYVQQEEKTTWEDRRLVSGWNCTAQSVCSEMQLTKERFHKTDGRQYYHFVQSFAETDDLTPQEAHAIALALVQREFPNFEVLVATHRDASSLRLPQGRNKRLSSAGGRGSGSCRQTHLRHVRRWNGTIPDRKAA